MKLFGKLIKLILIGVNIVIAFGYLLCAYSPYIRPQSHPILACAGLAIPIFIFLNLACIVGWLFIRRRYSLFSLVVLFMGFGSLRAYWPIGFADRGDTSSDTIKFLTYNTQGMPWGDVDKDDINPILAYLKESEADIICLQEFIPGIHVSEKVINETLSDYPYHEKVAFGDGGNGTLHSLQLGLASDQFNNQRFYRNVYDFSPENIRDGDNILTVVLVAEHLNQHEFSGHGKSRLQSLDVHHILQLIQLFFDLLQNSIVTSGNKNILGELKTVLDRSNEIWGLQGYDKASYSYIFGHENICITLYDTNVKSLMALLVPGGFATHQNGVYGRGVYNIETSFVVKENEWKDIKGLELKEPDQEEKEGICRFLLSKYRARLKEVEKEDESLYSYYQALMQTVNTLDQYENFEMSKNIFWLLFSYGNYAKRRFICYFYFWNLCIIWYAWNTKYDNVEIRNQR